MRFCYRSKFVDWRIVALTILLLLMHTIAVKTFPYSIPLFLIENTLLLYTVLKRRLDKFLYLLTIFLSTTYDVPLFVDESLTTVYSIGNLPFVQGYLFILFIISFIPLIWNKDIWKDILVNTSLRYVAKFVLYLFVIGIIVGFVTMFTDGTSLSFRVVMMFRYLFTGGIHSVLALHYIYEYHTNIIFRSNIRIILFSLLISIIIVSLLNAILGFRGDYSGEEILLTPLSLFFSTLIFFFFFNYEYRNRYGTLIILLVLTSFYMQFSYSNALGGKSWLVLVVMLFFLLYKLFAISKSLFFICIGFSILAIPAILDFVNEKSKEDSHSSRKLVQATMLITSLSPEKYDYIPSSPKARIEEFFNTSEEYIHHPCFMLFGKGYGGGHRDYRKAYNSGDFGLFSREQFDNGYYVFTHETVNGIYLRSGLYGMYLFFLILIVGVKNSINSPWMIVGCIWLLFFWGYSLALFSIGFPALIIGFAGIDKYKDRGRICI